MEQQEEKKIKVYKRQRRRSKSSSSFPIDLVSEIFLKLPEISVMRFRCVSKPWSSITADPYFIKLFKAQSPRLVLCFKAKNKMFVSSIPQHHQIFEISNKSYSSSQPIDRYYMEFSIHGVFPHTPSVQGLICFQQLETLIVWNPSTREFLTLPKPITNKLSIFLGYDPVESKHKVMCIPLYKCSDEGRVLTLGSTQESWRTVKTNTNPCLCYHYSGGPCIKGVVYYIAYVRHTHTYVSFLMSFDVRTEKFDKIELPPSPSYGYHYRLIAYQGRLACIDTKPNMKNGIRLWILKDAEKHKWSSKDFLAPLYLPDKTFILKGFTHIGEFIYVKDMFRKSSCVLFCDPVRNSFRKFELRGIIDGESALSNADGNELLVFPSHVESRVCL